MNEFMNYFSLHFVLTLKKRKKRKTDFVDHEEFQFGPYLTHTPEQKIKINKNKKYQQKNFIKF